MLYNVIYLPKEGDGLESSRVDKIHCDRYVIVAKGGTMYHAFYKTDSDDAKQILHTSINASAVLKVTRDPIESFGSALLNTLEELLEMKKSPPVTETSN